MLPHTCSLSNEHLHYPSIKHYHVQYTKHIQFVNPTPLPTTQHTLPPLHKLTLKHMSTTPILTQYTQHLGFVFGYPIAVTVFGVMFLICLTVMITIYVQRKPKTSKHSARASRKVQNQEIPMLPQ